MAVKEMNAKGIRRLAIAVCRQWLTDSKPKAGQEMVEHYATLLQQMRMVEYYRQAEISLQSDLLRKVLYD